MDTKKAAMIAAACGGAVFLGVLLPWYRTSMDLRLAAAIGVSTPQTVNGTQWEYMGTFTLLLGLLAGAASLFLWRGAPQGLQVPRRNLAWVAAGGFALATLLTFIDFLRASPWPSGLGLQADRGVGIFLTLAAAATGAVLSFLVLRATPGTAGAPTPPPSA